MEFKALLASLKSGFSESFAVWASFGVVRFPQTIQTSIVAVLVGNFAIAHHTPTEWPGRGHKAVRKTDVD